MDSVCIPTASIPTVAVTSGVQTPSPIVFPTRPRDAVVDLLGVPSCRRIVSSKSFMATNVATGEDSLCFWHYLHIPVASHQKALAQMLLADSFLAEVHLWHADRYCPLVPRKWRLCRFCNDEVENPPHAMFGCNGSPELVDLQSTFLESIFLLSPSLHLAALSATPESFFIIALSHRHICNVLAKLAYDTLQVFGQREMFVVDSALYLNAVVPPTVTSSIPSNSML